MANNYDEYYVRYTCDVVPTVNIKTGEVRFVSYGDNIVYTEEVTDAEGNRVTDAEICGRVHDIAESAVWPVWEGG